jgi:signal transduction histidine kinase/integral membrane sensor domain MASE1/ActR/RegA family two-component response regulator
VSSPARLGLLLPLIATLYFAAAKLGLALAFVAPQVTAVWPPTGIALAALIVFGLRTWPAVWIGALLANATVAPIPVAIGIATGNTLEAIAGAWLLSRYGFRPSLERIRHVLILLGAGALLSTTVSATIGLSSLCIGGVQPWSAFGRIWTVWWLGDAMSVLVVAPPLLVWSGWPPRHGSRDRAPEALALAAGLVAALWLIFGARPMPDATPLHYLMFPFVIVAALRFGQPATTAVTAVASAVAIWGTAAGIGPFVGEDIAQAVVQAQLFLAVIAVTGLILASAISERALEARFRAADYAATQALAESASLGEGAKGVLRAICQSLDWHFGSLWLVAGDDRLRCLETWHVPSRDFPEFEAETRRHAFERGVGLPGRVWAKEEPVWISDAVVDANFPRAPTASREGLHGAFAFPIRSGSGVLGVIEFFSRELQEPDADLLARIAALGSQIGQFVDRKRAEDEREQLLVRERAARSEAELANRAKDEFLAMLGHELRNPLGAITNAASVLDRFTADDRVTAAKAIIARQASHLALLVNDLLDVARVQTGRVELQREAVDLGKLIERCAETLAAVRHPDDPDPELRISTEPLLVDGDPARLDQIVTNLLANALKYTPSGGHIHVHARGERNRAVLRVKDDGVGISPDLLPRVFDLFVQADRSLDRSKGGLGLGLTLVKRLVELHGGTVSAHSGGPGLGSEFVVDLPLASAEGARGADFTTPIGANARRVLVVDDHVDARESLRLLLSAAGHAVITAEDGVEGLDKLRSWRPDVAIIDIGLPRLDGYAVARAVRSNPELQDVLLVALTGYGQRDDRFRAIEAGFQLHLVKPVAIEALGRVLDSAVVRPERA